MRNRPPPRSRRVGNAFVFFELSVVMAVRCSGSVPCFVSDSSTDVGRPATSFVAASKWRSGRAFFSVSDRPPPQGTLGWWVSAGPPPPELQTKPVAATWTPRWWTTPTYLTPPSVWRPQSTSAVPTAHTNPPLSH